VKPGPHQRTIGDYVRLQSGWIFIRRHHLTPQTPILFGDDPL
jgi:hypothetical protein